MESADRATVERILESTLEKIDAESLDDDEATLCRSLLSALDKHVELAAKICEVFATLGRKAEFRSVAETCTVFPSIVPLLSSDQSDVRLQAMRAVGNLCIDHDSNREAVLVTGGCPFLIAQLTRCADTTTADSQSVKVKCVTCGCILNLANDNEKLQNELNSLDALAGLSSVLSVPDQEESVLDMALQAVSVLLEQAELSGPSPLPSALAILLPRCSQGEVDLLENVLETLEVLVNKNDSLKRGVVAAECVDHLLVPMDVEAEQKASNIIVTLLAEDQCLESLFKAGNVLSSALASLKGHTSTQEQRANAALLLANMARSENNCQVLVERGVVPRLVELLKEEESKEMMGKLHHSALSALRNLSLPATHKEFFFSCGVVEGVLSLLTTSSLAHVWFKALGVLRLLVDGQAATCSYIVSQPERVKRVCEVCSAVGPAHIQLEGSRLLAAIVKNCHNSDVMRCVVSEGGVPWVCGLLDSEHTVMTNEGLIALNLLATLNNDALHSALCVTDVNLPLRLSKVLMTSAPEIVSNALRLMEILTACDHDQLKEEMRGNKELASSLSELTKHSNQDISSIAAKLLL
ncbi:rap1 GTPase-GDP dissociation stimulator 1-like [Halichondria panicea]|uniref:rap1 GTPase-GDP dissociation stimulator 1-like n=1 Tax=Halichondria panicea TaxID=6063 RepID=UPI00312BA5D2